MKTLSRRKRVSPKARSRSSSASASAAPTTTTSPELGKVRKRIDGIDESILDLLGERAALARRAGSLKRLARVEVLHDPERERHVLERLSGLAGKGARAFPPDAVRAVFREIMSGCLALEEPLRVAYLGPEGTFSQMAARRLFGLQPRYRECATIEAVFDAVRTKDAAYGVVPFENSTEGAVNMTSDALLEGELLIRQELVLPVSHCLMSRASSFSAIQTVYSHPQALAQCRGWIAKHLPRAQVVQATSTAAAAREAREDRHVAAIGSETAAELHDLPIVRRNVQDRPENATRFVVIARQDAPPSGADRTTIAFGVVDQKGALRRVLSIFEEHDVNLTRIESRPSRREAWHYVFLVDVDGHRKDGPLAAALREVERSADFVKVVGSYPRATGPTTAGGKTGGRDPGKD